MLDMEEAFKKIIGLNKVKDQMRKMKKMLQLNELRRKKGLSKQKDDKTPHMVSDM